MEGRLASGHTDAIHPSSERVKTLESVLERDGAVLFRMEDERMIMAVGASEIAAREKENRADLPRPIDKRRL
jgi:hypothetical protein